MRAASDCLDRLAAPFSLIDELAKAAGDGSRLGEAHISQPTCTAVQLGLTELLASWGVRPSMVVGHSSGEIGAAYAAGALTLEDAMAVAYHRGHLSGQIKSKNPQLAGAMLAVGTGPAEVKRTIKLLGLSDITVACENSPASVTVSGDEAGVNALAVELEKQSTFNRKLRVSVAYHSAHMKVIADDYLAALKDVRPRPVRDGIAFYSALEGRRNDKASLGASYWVENLTHPVLFSSAVAALVAESKPDIVAEIGPHSALEGPIKQILKASNAKVEYLPSIVRNKHSTLTMLQLAGNLFVQGADLRFDEINQTKTDAQRPALLIGMKPYPWSDHKYWSKSRAAKQHRNLPFKRHDLLGRLEDAFSDTEPVWRNVLTTDDVPWLKNHRMQSFPTFPLAGYLSMAVEAACQRAQLRGIDKAEITSYRLREIQSSKALMLDDGARFETVLSMRAYAEGLRSYSNDWDEFTISSWEKSRGWLEHCRGLVSIRKAKADNAFTGPKPQGATLRRSEAMRNDGQQRVPLDEFYAELERNGAGYSSSFTLQPGSGLTGRDQYASSSIVVPDTAPQMPLGYESASILSAAFVDLMFQQTFAILGAGRGKMPTLFMPSAIKEVDLSASLPNQPGQKIQAVAHGCPEAGAPAAVDFWIDGWHGSKMEPVIRITGFKMTPVSNQDFDDYSPRSICYNIKWEPFKGRKAMQVNGASNGHANGHAKGHANGHSNGHVNGKSNGHVNGHANGNATTKSTTNGHVNGHANGHTNGHTNGHSNGHENGHGSLEDDGPPTCIVSDKGESDKLVATLSDLIKMRSGSRASVCSLAKLEPSSSARYICLAEMDAPLLHNMSAETFDRVQSLLLNAGSVLWVTAGAYRNPEAPHRNLAQGLLRTVRSEAGKVAALLDLDLGSRLSATDRAELIMQALSASQPADDGTEGDVEFAEQQGHLVVPRVVRQEQMDLDIFRETQSTTPYLQDFVQAGRRLQVVIGNYGALDSLFWTDEEPFILDDREIEIKVAATGMNFKDVVITMGQVASPYVGVECSGTVTRVGRNVISLKVGDSVCAMVRGAYGTYAICHDTSAAVMPADMSFETAASLPVIYSTAYYGLVELARMERGEKILIHAASGGVGQAAIQLSQMIGAEIFATVGSADKKKLITEKYGIPANRIFYSRDTEFGAAVREATSGVGVDVVLNSLAGDLLRETWDCLAPFGRFIEIGKRDIVTNSRFEMAKFNDNCTFSSVDLTLVASQRPKIMSRVLTSVMDLLTKKTVKPIGPITTVGIGEVESALRSLQGGKTTGKMVASHTAPNQKVKTTHPVKISYLKADATYIIIGGTGGIGRSMAHRMVQRGARHIVLLSRTGTVTAELQQLMQRCKREGASIHVKKCDAADAAQVGTLIEELQAGLPAIRGVIHAAMVLKDVLFEKMTFDDYQAVVRSKVDSAWNFHEALLQMPLDFFVLLSSVSGIIGNRGQAAYAAANTFLDAFALHRRSKGLAATSLNLAAISDVGYLTQDKAKQAEVMKSISGSAMGEQELLALVEAALQGQVGKLCHEQCITGLDFSNPAALPYYASDHRFAYLRGEALAQVAQQGAAAESANLTITQKLGLVTDHAQALEIVTQGLQEKLGAILMVPQEVMAAQRDTTAVTAFGLDSLTAIELRNWIGKELQAPLQVLELLKGGLLGDLAATVLKKTKISGAWST